MNIPNILTVLRVILIPAFIYFLIQNDPHSRWMALFVFMIASISDFLDGYLARKWNQDTKFGRFLDPLADKALVVATIVAFVYLDKQIPLWMVLVIIGRDIIITLMRYLAIRKQMEIKTSRLGKWKTTFQMLSIVIIIMVFVLRSYRFDISDTFEKGHMQGKRNFAIAYELFIEGLSTWPKKDIPKIVKTKVFAESVPYFLMLFTTFVTIISGLRYLLTNYRVLYPPYRIEREKK